MRSKSLATFAGVLLFAAACSGGSGTAPTGSPSTPYSPGGSTGVPANTVIARTGIFFDPAALSVAVGTTISFTFESTGHNVTFDPTVNGRPADIPGINSNTTIDRTFSTKGTFPFRCTIHAGMTGTITVN